MLNAGMETSATLLEWSMSELVRNPATLARAQEEMESAVGRNRRIKKSDITKLDYLRCVVTSTASSAPSPRSDGKG
ncbi:hypothetical protein SUGI_0603040 [Cryptomeria japonica]|nr:hypothetical protein SUGI_0603040 [Cryptomeria japonica]